MRASLSLLVVLLLTLPLRAAAQNPAPTATATPASNNDKDSDAEPEPDASEIPRIGVLDVRSESGKTNKVTSQLRRALVRGLEKYRVQVVEDHPAVVGAYGRGADSQYRAGLKRARLHLGAGKKLYEKFDSKGAEAQLQKAADAFEENAGGLRSPDDLIDTYLLLSRVFFATNREIQARDIFERLVQLNPNLKLDAARYPPQMVKSFRTVKSDVMGSPLGRLKVTATPSHSTVFLDGKRRGVAKPDLQIVNLPAGIHVLVVRRAGYAPFVRRVDITSFRIEKVAAALGLDRHPKTHALVGKDTLAEIKALDTQNVLPYLDDVSKTAGLALIAVGTAVPKDGGIELKARLYHSKKQALTPVRIFQLPKKPRSLDDAADALLKDAADAGLIDDLAARRNVASGGGALDETATFRGHLAVAPGYALPGTATNFPTVPGVGLRVGVVRRLTSRLLLSGETGLDTVIEPSMTLRDATGVVVAEDLDNVSGVYSSIPLEVGARYYIGVGTFAPYLATGGGIRWDMLYFQEDLPFDEISAPGGLGWNAYFGIGTDWALSTGTGLFAEARGQIGAVGVGDAVVSTPGNPEGRLPIEAGTQIGFRVLMGYLRVF